jgi:O-Antigen ligase
LTTAAQVRPPFQGEIRDPLAATAEPHRTYKAQTYGALLVMIAVPVLCVISNQAGLLRVVLPLLSLLVGGFLFWRSKPLYVGLVCWLWFVTPFLGRMSDFQAGSSATNSVLLAPYLAAGISVVTLFTSLQSLGQRKSLPYICAFASILYGAIIGLVRYPLFDVLRALLNWVVPVIFGFFVYQHPELYQEFRRVIERSFLYGILVTGAYGIYQFFTLPDWDKLWMLDVQLNSFGAVEAQEIRVFSTMNAPAIFAAVSASGLLLMFCSKGKLRLLSAACGFLALMLTMSRASWLSLIAGFVFLATKLEMRQRVRLAIAAVACVLILLASLQIPVIDNVVSKRIRTFSDPSQDVSYAARIEGHEAAFRQISQEPFGEGIGSTDAIHNTEGDDDFIGPHDSTVLEFLYSLGWIGTMIYGVGLGILVGRMMGAGRSDPFVLAAQAIVIGFVAQCLLNSVMLGVLGFMVWVFASMALARVELSEQEVQQYGSLNCTVP